MPLFTDTHPDGNMTYADMLECLDCPGEFEVSNWEADFLDSLLKQKERSSTLSDAQAAKIVQLADKYLS